MEDIRKTLRNLGWKDEDGLVMGHMAIVEYINGEWTIRGKQGGKRITLRQLIPENSIIMGTIITAKHLASHEFATGIADILRP